MRTTDVSPVSVAEVPCVTGSIVRKPMDAMPTEKNAPTCGPDAQGAVGPASVRTAQPASRPSGPSTACAARAPRNASPRASLPCTHSAWTRGPHAEQQPFP